MTTRYEPLFDEEGKVKRHLLPEDVNLDIDAIEMKKAIEIADADFRQERAVKGGADRVYRLPDARWTIARLERYLWVRDLVGGRNGIVKHMPKHLQRLLKGRLNRKELRLGGVFAYRCVGGVKKSGMLTRLYEVKIFDEFSTKQLAAYAKKTQRPCQCGCGEVLSIDERPDKKFVDRKHKHRTMMRRIRQEEKEEEDEW